MKFNGFRVLIAKRFTKAWWDMATIKDVAKTAGVSLATVSKYLNGGSLREENAQAVAAAIAKLNYHVNPFARNLKAQHSRSIGILLPDISAPFFGSVVTSLDKTLRENGFHTLISCYGANHGLERENLQFLLSSGIEGLVYIPEDLSPNEFLELTSPHNIPIVQVDRVIQGTESDAVLVNNADAVYDAVTSLIKKGHRRIATIAGPKSVYTAKERHIGYLRALSDHDILYDDALSISGDNTFATGYLGFEALINLPEPPTAVFTSNYDITMGLLTAAREQGLRIPEDLDIFGFDCVHICSMMKPPLPVVHQPENEIGVTAANFLVERLSGFSGEPRIAQLPCRLVGC